MRHVREELDESGQDSFLDVVANIVGVLIILVMIVGASATQSALRAQQAKAEQTEPTESPTEQVFATHAQPVVSQAVDFDLETAALSKELKLISLQADHNEVIMRQAVLKAIDLRLATARHEQQRIQLAMHQTIVQEDIEQRRSQLDTQTQQEYDTQRQLFEVKLKLKELSFTQIQIASEASDVESIEVLPTPIARRVDGYSIHLRVKGGRVCVVPFQELQDKLMNDFDYYQRILGNKDRAKATLGPVDGFRLRVTMVERSEPGAVTGPRVGRAAQQREIYPVCHWIPDSEELGFNVEQVLLPNSSFFRQMKELREQTDVLVVWLYKDSFDQFRPLKRMLYELGFLFDIRILPLDAYIAASRHGRDSYAQ